jgi:hypothetical protein
MVSGRDQMSEIIVVHHAREIAALPAGVDFRECRPECVVEVM